VPLLQLRQLPLQGVRLLPLHRRVLHLPVQQAAQRPGGGGRGSTVSPTGETAPQTVASLHGAGAHLLLSGPV
jgi:hypothetical protein